MVSLIKNKGFTLVEVMVSVALLMVMAIGGMSANSLATASVTIDQQRSRANFLAREAMESVLSIRAGSYTSLVAGNFHPVKTKDGWILSPGPEVLGDFTRSITLSNVMREISCSERVCNIVSAGGVTDEGSMKAKVTISWKEGGKDKSYTIDSLVTYWR